MKRELGLTFLLLMGTTQASFAEIDFKDLAGAHGFFQLTEKCNYLAPDIALGLARQGKLNQDFIYGDDHNPAVKLVRVAFNSVSENSTFFQVSPVGSNIAKFLSPSLVGMLIR